MRRRLSILAIAVVIPLVAMLSLPGRRGRTGAGPESKPRKTLRISDIKVSGVDETSVVVSWRTNVPADSQVTWGKDSPGERASPLLSELEIEHSVLLRELEPGVTYSLCVISSDARHRTVSVEGPRFRTAGLARFEDLCNKRTARVLRNLPAMGAGIAWGDYDNDGDFDLFVASEANKGCRLFRNDGRVFSDRTGLSATGFGERGRSVAWADYNADGRLDILVVSSSAIRLFVNEGPPAWTFRDVSSLVPPQQRYDCEGAGWIDYNNDGKPDILVTNGKYGVLLFENRVAAGSGFVDVSGKAGLGARGFGAGFGDYVSIADYNGDGETDFLYNLYGGVVARNEGGRFVSDDGSGIAYFSASTRKLGTAFGDYDNDGRLDLFVPQRGGSKLYHNEGGGKFAEVTVSSGISASDSSVVAAWGDVDNDGYLDLFVGNEFMPSRLYINNGDGTFTDRTERYGVVTAGGRPRGTCFADFDGDGDVDLFVRNYNSPNVFYENGAAGARGHDHLAVRFGRKRSPIGAQVWLYDGDKLVGFREISGGAGYGSQEPPEAHFGAKPGRYRVRVRFTDGTARELHATVRAGRRNVVVVN